jgi:hypothetical protein
MQKPTLPNPTDAEEVHADWLEWCAMASGQGFASWSDHQRDLGLGDEDVLSEEVLGTRPFEVLVDATAAELQDRARGCGTVAYPFEVLPDGLSYRRAGAPGIYEFLLSIAMLGKDAAPSREPGERLFEELSVQAALAYLGSREAGAKVFPFGFPRTASPSSFTQALDQLCKELGEGYRAPSGRLTDRHKKDAKLDLVAWRPFQDGRGSQLILFGQCATGVDWFDKVHELDADAWCKTWITKPPLVTPVETFFLPRRIERERWEEASRHGGILFDRCRISSLVDRPDEVFATRLADWTTEALARGNAP